MTDTPPPPTDQQHAAREEILAALSTAGAYCGDCGFEPGEIGCSDCVRVRELYADALTQFCTALEGVARREALTRDLVLAEGAELLYAVDYDEHNISLCCRDCAMESAAAVLLAARTGPDAP